MKIPATSRRRLIPVLVSLMLIAACPAPAAELALSTAEIDNLGIELAVPRTAERLAGVAGRGRVVVPPDQDRVVSAAQPGLVMRLHAAEGDAVSRGQLLAELRSPGFVSVQREFLDAVTADRLARARLARDRSLVEEGIASRRRLETTQAEAQAAAASLLEHRQMLAIAGLSEAEIDDLAARRKLSGLLAVRSPIDGVVLDRAAQAGAGVSETDPLYRVADLSTLWLEIDVPQDRTRALQPGMAVALDGHEGVSARVSSVGRAVNPHTQMVTVRATVTSETSRLRPGAFVTARFLDGLGSQDRSWAVPAGSVVRSGSGHFVFVRTESGFVVRPVEYLGVEGDLALVAGELSAETPLAVTGVSALKALWGSAADEDA